MEKWNCGCGNESEDLPRVANGSPPSERDGAEALSLDFIKNNSHSVGGYEGQVCYVGYIQGVYHVGDYRFRAINKNIRCKKWSCPHCNPINKKNLKRRLYNGGITEFVRKNKLNDFPYVFKMMTLTCPGKEFREQYTPKQALNIMNKNYEKLRKAMRKKWGDFYYLRVVEPHRDGYPHFHTLIVGHAIAPKEVLEQIRRLWTDKYGMGNVDIQVLKRGLGAGINYITKYLTKDLKPITKGSRVFTASRGALQAKKKPHWEKCTFYYGVKRNDELNEEIEIDYQLPENIQEGEFKAILDYPFNHVLAPF